MTSTYHFCTYFDEHYLFRGLALYSSLKRHCPRFRLWVLCLDRTSLEVMAKLQLSNVELIALAELEMNDPELRAAKANRSTVEYYFTCTPSLPRFILNHHAEVDRITYLDADLFFFSDPKEIFDEIGEHPIAVIEHRFPLDASDANPFGTFNVAWLSFRRDPDAMGCLAWWSERCLEWCYDRCDDGRFADQKYLDEWPTRFRGVHVVRHKGADVAPWNLANYTIRADERTVWVDDVHLIFYHFHGLRQMTRRLVQLNLRMRGVVPSAVLRQHVYGPYVRVLATIRKEIRPLYQSAVLVGGIRQEKHPQWFARPLRTALAFVRSCRALASRDFVVVSEGRAIINPAEPAYRPSRS